MRIVGLADSDSYVKWGAALLGTLPPEWDRELLVVDSQFTVNDAQLDTALTGSGIASARRIGYRDILDTLRAARPDAVLVAAPGPVTMVLVRLVAGLESRPVIVTGLPGISIPATAKALRWRRQSDLMVVHSRRELRDFDEMSRARRWGHRLGLARIPFAFDHRAGGDDLVFAAQAVVPRERAQRLEVARMLRDAALADPTRRVVVKLRALPGERSTHPERDAYPDLFATLGPLPENLVFATGSMQTALDRAAGLVTVSSTALLEAVARDIPVIAIDTFGVSDKLINPVFADSGLFGGRDDVIARRFRHPRVEWRADNYFQDDGDDTAWIRRLDELVAARRAGRLDARPAWVSPGGPLRVVWDRKMAFGSADRSLTGFVVLAIGIPARGVLRRARRVAELVRTRRTPAARAG